MSAEELGGLNSEKTIRVVETNGRQQVLAKGRVYMSWGLGDEGSLRMAIVQLYENGIGTQEQLAEAFGMHVNSVQKYITSFAQEGMGGLLSQARGPRASWKLTPRLRGKILLVTLRDGFQGVEAVQRRLREVWREEVSAPSIRELLAENGLIAEPSGDVETDGAQGELFPVEEDLGQLDHAQRVMDLFAERAEAGDEPRLKPQAAEDGIWEQRSAGSAAVRPGCVGQAKRHYSSAQRVYLDRLERGDYNAYAGGLLFAPLLERYEFVPTVKRVIALPTHEGYSLEELCLSLFYLDVFRFESMEDFKRGYAEEFGVLMGRVQSPSVYSLRRFLHKVRALGRGEALIDEFGRGYLQHGLAQRDVMYIDGHFMPYYGIYPISKGWHGVRQMPMKGSYNFLVVDEEFCPWLFLVRASSEDLLQKIPELIAKAQRLASEAGCAESKMPLVVLFDREGYSAELYRQLEGNEDSERKGRVIFISWAKYADRWVYDEPEDKFDRVARVVYQIKKPETIRYFQTTRMMSKYGKIRTVVIQSGRDKKRAAIFTNGTDEEIGAERVVQLMCRRWGEENRIKDLLTMHKINYMPGYVMESIGEQPWVDNPKAKALKKKRGALQAELRDAKVRFADEVRNKKLEQAEAPIIRSEGLLPLENIVRKENEILLLNQQLDRLPKRVRFDEAHEGRKLLALNYEKKRFLDCIKVFSCNMREAMGRMLRPHYDYPKEIQPALSMIIERAGHVRLEANRVSPLFTVLTGGV
jgi:transposase